MERGEDILEKKLENGREADKRPVALLIPLQH